MVVKKGRYAELYESVPGKRGKKRFVRYLGILGQIDWKATFSNTDYGVDWAAVEQEELSRIKKQEAAEEARAQQQRAAFKEATGLELPVGPADPVPIEKVPASRGELKSEAPAESDANDSATPS